MNLIKRLTLKISGIQFKVLSDNRCSVAEITSRDT